MLGFICFECFKIIILFYIVNNSRVFVHIMCFVHDIDNKKE